MIPLHADALLDEALAIRYLRDQGHPVDDRDMLRLHINAVSGYIRRLTGRSQLKYSATAINEVRMTHGGTFIWTRNAPIRSLDSLTLYPYDSGLLTTITGPGTSLSNDDLVYDPEMGRITLLTYELPEQANGVAIAYKAGWYDNDEPNSGDPADADLSALRLIALEALLRKWQRWIEKRVGVSSRSTGQTSVNYDPSDFDASVLEELRRFRRPWAV